MTTIRIQATYSENYGFSEGKEHWKPKGTIEFQTEMPIEWVMYDRDRVTAIIKDMLAEQSNDACRYRYVSLEPIFTKPVILDPEDFKRRFQAGGQ